MHNSVFVKPRTLYIVNRFKNGFADIDLLCIIYNPSGIPLRVQSGPLTAIETQKVGSVADDRVRRVDGGDVPRRPRPRRERLLTKSTTGATFEISDGMVVVIVVISGFVVTYSLELLLLEDIDELRSNFSRFSSLK